MNYQTRGIHLSLIIHAIVFGVIAMSSVISPSKSRVITIDFSVNDQRVVQDTSNSITPEEKKKEVITKRVENRVIEDRPEPHALPPAISENQTPVAAQKQKRDEVKDVIENTASNIAPVQTNAGSKDSGKSREDVYIKESFSYIRDAIQKKVTYPKMARKMGWEGNVRVSFIINPDGCVRDIRVVQSSGFELLDRHTIEAVKNASPFPRPPAEARLVIPIVYRLS
ncbi:MAG: energy transducer TonB [Nitrospirae bacterium]|nr:energy transducer TonB [Nitrospirota bacterium]